MANSRPSLCSTIFSSDKLLFGEHVVLTFECLFLPLCRASANSTCSSGEWGGAGSCPCPCGWVEFGAEASNTVSAWFPRSLQNWSIFAIVADVEPPWAGGFPGAVRWILGFWPVEEFLHLGRQYQKPGLVNPLWPPGSLRSDSYILAYPILPLLGATVSSELCCQKR